MLKCGVTCRPRRNALKEVEIKIQTAEPLSPRGNCKARQQGKILGLGTNVTPLRASAARFSSASDSVALLSFTAREAHVGACVHGIQFRTVQYIGKGTEWQQQYLFRLVVGCL